MDAVVDYLHREQAHVVIAVVLLHLARVAVGHLALMWTNSYRASAKTQKKIMSNAWYMTYYFAASVVGAYLLFFHTPFSGDAAMCNWSMSSTAAFADYPSLYIYYVVQIAFYMEYIFAIMAGLDVHRKDAKAFIIHHIVTVALIVYSRYADQMPTQLAILVLHDSADPYLHVTKFAQAGFPAAAGLQEASSILFAAVFYVTRLFVFPWKVIRPCVNQLAVLTPRLGKLVEGAAPGVYSGYFVLPGQVRVDFLAAAVSLLFVLYALHVFWAVRIAQVAYNTYVAKTGKIQDPDEDIDDEPKRLLRPRHGGKTAKTKKAE